MKATVNNINHEFWQYNMSIKSQEMFSVYIVYFIKDLDVYSLNFLFLVRIIMKNVEQLYSEN